MKHGLVNRDAWLSGLDHTAGFTRRVCGRCGAADGLYVDATLVDGLVQSERRCRDHIACYERIEAMREARASARMLAAGILLCALIVAGGLWYAWRQSGGSVPIWNIGGYW